MAGPATTSRGFLLSTRFGRRIFTVFVLCALLPVAVLTAIAWHEVREQLLAQARLRLHQASRAAGMDVVQRLVEAERDVRELAARSRPADLELHGLVTAAVRRGADGGVTLLAGHAFRPELDPAAEARLASGRSALHVSTAAGSPRIVLALPGRATGEAIVAELLPERIFLAADEERRPAGIQLCFFDTAGRALQCSLPGFTGPPAADGDALVPWGQGDGTYLALPWTLFLRAAFGADAWTVVAAATEQDVLAPAASFRAALVPVAVGSLLLVTWLSLAQIRRRLEPLEQLRDGTRRIAAGDFAARVRLRSDDEIEDLAEAFDAMAARLGGHFDALRHVIGADRALLEASDEAQLAARFLARFAPLYPAELCMLAIAADGRGDRLRLHVARDESSLEQHEAPGLGPGGRAALRTDAVLSLGPSELPPAWTDLLGVPPSPAVIFPLWSGEELEGLVVALGQAGTAEPERELFARQLCEQLASALRGTRLRQQNEQLLAFDPLTGLLNRHRFAEEVRRAVTEVDDDARLAVLRISAEGFARVAETFGPDESGHLAVALGRALASVEGARAARFEGGEFALLLPSLDEQGLTRRVRQVLAALVDAIDLHPRAHAVSLRAGVAVYPVDTWHAGELLRHAETAAGHARHRGSDAAVYFSGDLNRASEEKARLEIALQDAVASESLEVRYQPIVDTRSGETVAAEALVRWRHAELGEVPPAEFIPLAEETGLIASLGRQILRSVCDQMARWDAEGVPPVRIHVNVSALQVAEGSLFGEVHSALLATRIPASRLCLELTESALVGEDPGTLESLHAIRRLGVSLSVDDFGTGYSSLAYLKRLPIETLKVDRSFVTGIARDPDDRAILEAIVNMAGGLGLGVVAEGVETEEQLAVLRACDCPQLQGYLFSVPLSADDFAKRLREES